MMPEGPLAEIREHALWLHGMGFKAEASLLRTRAAEASRIADAIGLDTINGALSSAHDVAIDVTLTTGAHRQIRVGDVAGLEESERFSAAGVLLPMPLETDVTSSLPFTVTEMRPGISLATALAQDLISDQARTSAIAQMGAVIARGHRSMPETRLAGLDPNLLLSVSAFLTRITNGRPTYDDVVAGVRNQNWATAPTLGNLSPHNIVLADNTADVSHVLGLRAKTRPLYADLADLVAIHAKAPGASDTPETWVAAIETALSNYEPPPGFATQSRHLARWVAFGLISQAAQDMEMRMLGTSELTRDEIEDFKDRADFAKDVSELGKDLKGTQMGKSALPPIPYTGRAR